MIVKTQKQVFLEGEGDAYLHRNIEKCGTEEEDRVLQAVRALPLFAASQEQANKKIQVLEIGCGRGDRLIYLQKQFNAACSGIEPSGESVKLAQQAGIDARQGTADALPWPAASFDLIIFGFCLYLCDRADLFAIAAAADRVLKTPGWIIIHDFYCETPRANPYVHFPGVKSHKMDYRRLFSWHPAYQCLFHEILHHETHTLTDDQDQWVAISLLRKNPLD